MSGTSAAASYLGYEYQSLQALLLVVPSGSNSKVYIERFDDVEFEDGEVKKLIQNKFSLRNDAKITIRDNAFWKSVGNWIDLIKSGIVAADDHHFIIATTRKSDDELILRLTEDPKSRKSKEILDDLIDFAEENKDKNQENKKSIYKFLKLTYEKKIALVEKIQILINRPNVPEIQEKINIHLKDWSHEQSLVGFLDEIYGWWYRQILKRLSEDVNEPLTHKELVEAIQYFRDRQSAKSLPIYFDKINDPQKIIDAHRNYKFVKQLNHIDLDESSIELAMLDYYLAIIHRGEWVRKLNHISVALKDYDDELYQKWDSEFRSIKREIARLNITDDIKLKEMGTKIFEWMDKYYYYPKLKLERDIAKIWLWKGSFHILADDGKKLGWHPNFRELMEKED